MARVKITYTDTDSLTMEEIVKQAHHNYGSMAVIDITADSTIPHDQIYFALQQIITREQLELLYDKDIVYQSKLQELRSNTLGKLAQIMDQVIIDNETKVL